MKNTHNQILIALLLISLSNILFAATAKKEKWYEVEVIVFTNHSENTEDLEKWPNKPDSPDILRVLDLFSPTELLMDDVDNIPLFYVEPMVTGDDNLNYIANRIEKSTNYSLVMHRIWRQTAVRRKSVDPVYLDDAQSDNLYQPLGNKEAIEEQLDEISAEQSLLNALLEEEINFTQPDNRLTSEMHPFDPIIPFEDNRVPNSAPVALSPMGPPNHALYGTLKLFKNRFLHVTVDFLYRTPPSFTEPDSQLFEPETPLDEPALVEENELLDTDNEALEESAEILTLNTQEKPPSIGFRHAASKRIRLKEVHYFDHPVFGVIVRVIRYVEPEPEEVLEASN